MFEQLTNPSPQTVLLVVYIIGVLGSSFIVYYGMDEDDNALRPMDSLYALAVMLWPICVVFIAMIIIAEFLGYALKLIFSTKA